MNWIEKTISSFFPSWAARRAQARHIRRSFDGADLNRLRARGSYPSLGPITEARQSRETLLRVARDLDRNNSFAHGAFNSIANNIVGAGIKFQSVIANADGKLMEGPNADGKLMEGPNEQIEKAFNEWAKAVDFQEQLSLWEVQHLVERELWVAGEILVVQSNENLPGRIPPLRIDLVESERLAALDEERGGGIRVVQGVEFNARDQITAYHIYPTHPADATRTATPERVPATRVLHLFHRQRPNQIRGIPRIAPVAKNFEALGQYMDHELTKARVASAFALMIKRGGMSVTPRLPSAGSTADTVDDNDNPIGHLEGGMIFTGGPQDSIEGTGPSINSSGFVDFLTANLRAIATGLNISYELLARDFSKASFSSARQSQLEDMRHWTPRQDYLNRHLNEEIFNWFVDSAIIAGIQPFSANEGRMSTQWITPNRAYIDPQKELAADVDAVASGFTTIQRVAAKHGTDVYSNIAINSQVMQQAKDAGLKLKPFEGSEPEPEPPPPEDNEGDEANEDRAEGGGKERRLQARASYTP